MPFYGKEDRNKNKMTCKGEIDFKHGEPEPLQALITALCTVDTSKLMGLNDVQQPALFRRLQLGYLGGW